MIGWLRKRLHCPHRRVEGIYGDEINMVGGYRLQCLGCRAFLDGPVSLASEMIWAYDLEVVE